MEPLRKWIREYPIAAILLFMFLAVTVFAAPIAIIIKIAVALKERVKNKADANATNSTGGADKVAGDTQA